MLVKKIVILETPLEVRHAVAVKAHHKPFGGIVEVFPHLTVGVVVEKLLGGIYVEANHSMVLFELGNATFGCHQRTAHAAKPTLNVEASLIVVVERVAFDTTSFNESLNFIFREIDQGHINS